MWNVTTANESMRRNMLMTDIIFTVETEFGVKGYHAGHVTYIGTLDEVKAKIEKAGIDFARKLDESEEQNGDLRQYCPEFANGYPMLDHEGEDFDITILSVKSTQTVVTELEYDYHSPTHAAIRSAAGEEIEGLDAKYYNSKK